MTVRTARCHCGQLAVACEGEPRKISLCHCLDCQRRTGSAFSVAVFYDAGRVRLSHGEPSQFKRPSASGFPVTFNFCPECGSNVYWVPDRLPDMVGVAIGAFADPGFAIPEQAVWAKDRHLWLDALPSIAQHAENPVRPPAG